MGLPEQKSLYILKDAKAHQASGHWDEFGASSFFGIFFGGIFFWVPYKSPIWSSDKEAKIELPISMLLLKISTKSEHLPGAFPQAPFWKLSMHWSIYFLIEQSEQIDWFMKNADTEFLSKNILIGQMSPVKVEPAISISKIKTCFLSLLLQGLFKLVKKVKLR